jgi:hypothetical protein
MTSGAITPVVSPGFGFSLELLTTQESALYVRPRPFARSLADYNNSAVLWLI